MSLYSVGHTSTHTVSHGIITHHGDRPDKDEDLTPSLENMVVLTWLRLLHKDLPRLIKQRYGTELRSRTLASIKPEISQAMDTLLDEVQSVSESKIMRSQPFNQSQRPPSTANRQPSTSTANVDQLRDLKGVVHYASRPAEKNSIIF